MIPIGGCLRLPRWALLELASPAGSSVSATHLSRRELPVSGDGVRRVVVDASAGRLRRQLGPTSWVLFEELLLASTGAHPCVASVSVRSLAASLGLAKDTVAHALVRLRRAGLVTAYQTRTTTGSFATGTYRLTIPESISVTTRRVPAASSSPRSDDMQLELAIES